MDNFTKNYVDGFMADLVAENPGEKEFHQAVRKCLRVWHLIWPNIHTLWTRRFWKESLSLKGS